MFNKRQRLFDHQFLEFQQLETEMIDGKRYYLTPFGPLPSVTTILGQIGDKTWIEEWHARVGKEEADKILKQAGVRGTAIHKLCEDYLLNKEDYKRGAMPVNLETFSKLRPLLDKHIGKIYGLEIALYSDKLQTAGRADLFAEWDQEDAIIDFKTSKRVKHEEDIENYFIQASCYAEMASDLFKRTINKIVVLMAVDHDTTLCFVKDRKQYHNRMLSIFSQSRL